MRKLKEIQKTIRNKRIHDIRKREFQIAFKLHSKLSCVSRVLEVGCGDGYQSSLWAQKASEIVAIDISTQRIDHKIPNFVRCSGTYLPFRENTFDLFFSSHTLEHVNSRQRFVKEAIRVCTPNGLVVIVVPSVLWKCIQLLTYYINFFYRALIGTIISLRSSSNNKKSYVVREIIFSILPQVHGKYSNNSEELNAYRKESWTNLLKKYGLQILAVASTFPYGSLDFTVIPKAFHLKGPSSSYIFIGKSIEDFSHK